MTRNRGPLLDIGEIKCPVGNIDVYQCVLPRDTLKLEWGSLCFFAFFFFFLSTFFWFLALLTEQLNRTGNRLRERGGSDMQQRAPSQDSNPELHCVNSLAIA